MNTLEFGYQQNDITPKYGIPLCGYFNERPNKGAYDRLSVKAAAFRTDGKDYAAIISYDLCFITAKFVLDRLQARTQDARTHLQNLRYGDRICRGSADHRYYVSALRSGYGRDGRDSSCCRQR